MNRSYTDAKPVYASTFETSFRTFLCKKQKQERPKDTPAYRSFPLCVLTTALFVLLPLPHGHGSFGKIFFSLRMVPEAFCRLYSSFLLLI